MAGLPSMARAIFVPEVAVMEMLAGGSTLMASTRLAAFHEGVVRGMVTVAAPEEEAFPHPAEVSASTEKVYVDVGVSPGTLTFQSRTKGDVASFICSLTGNWLIEDTTRAPTEGQPASSLSAVKRR